jgi:protein-S-isoprenylcysteine O-methyltransferase Ste14
VNHLKINQPLRLLLHIPVPWVFVLSYLLGVLIERIFGIRIPLTLPDIGVLGWVLLAVGAVVAGWGLVTFRRARTTTVPGQASSALVTWGPYQFSRNPMYVGLTLAYLGEAAILRQGWPVILLPLVLAYLNFVVIPVEEAKLSEVFGDAYDRYRSSVRRWL